MSAAVCGDCPGSPLLNPSWCPVPCQPVSCAPRQCRYPVGGFGKVLASRAFPDSSMCFKRPVKEQPVPWAPTLTRWAHASQVVQGLLHTAEQCGAEFRCNAEVMSIDTANGRVSGVTLASGEVSTPAAAHSHHLRSPQSLECVASCIASGALNPFPADPENRHSGVQPRRAGVLPAAAQRAWRPPRRADVRCRGLRRTPVLQRLHVSVSQPQPP